MRQELSEPKVPALVVVIALAVFGFGYSFGSTVHGLIEDQQVTVVIAQNAQDFHSPQHDDVCEGEPVQKIFERAESPEIND